MKIKMILHITTQRQWNKAQVTGLYYPEHFELDGFIHCSSAAQVLNVADSFYRGQADLLLVCIDPKKVEAPLKYEPPVHPHGGFDPSPSDTIDLYPHIYGPLNLDAVVMVEAFRPKPDGTFELPEFIAALV